MFRVLKTFIILSILVRRCPLMFYSYKKERFPKKINYKDCENLSINVNLAKINKNVNDEDDILPSFDRYIEAVKKEINLIGEMEENKKEIQFVSFFSNSASAIIENFRSVFNEIDKQFIIKRDLCAKLSINSLTADDIINIREIGFDIFIIEVKKLGEVEREKIEELKNAINQCGFKRVTIFNHIDIETQTVTEVFNDIETAFYLGAVNVLISTTPVFSKKVNIKEKKKFITELLELCENKNYLRIGELHFAKSYDDDLYFTENFISFGSFEITNIDNKSFKNQKSLEKYVEHIENGEMAIECFADFTKKEFMMDYIWNRLKSGNLNSIEFREKFNIDINKSFPLVFLYYKKRGYIKVDGENILLTNKGVSHMMTII